MKANLRYLSYVIRHKWWVGVAGRRLGVSWWDIIIHDLSKFRPDEWKPYVDWFYGGAAANWPEAESLKRAFKHAVRLHKARNPHHVEYWVNCAGDPAEIPENRVRETVADWAGAGKAIKGRWEVRAFWDRAGPEMNLHPATRLRIEQLVSGWWYGWEELGE